MKRPFFSIVIPAYNRADFLKIAVNSVINQGFSDYELIIIDDGSIDNTKQVVYSYMKPSKLESTKSQNKIKYFYQDNKGPSSARNKGITESEGEFICFLDSDDRFCSRKLEETYSYIKSHPDYSIFHTEEIWYRSGRLLTQKNFHKKPSGFIFKEAVRLCCVSISTAAVKREIFSKIGLFDENIPACEDYDFWLRAAADYRVFLIPEFLTIKEGGHPDQQSKKHPAMDRFRIYALNKLLHSTRLSHKNYKTAYKEISHKCNIYVEGALKRKKSNEASFYQDLILKLKKEKHV